MNAPDSRKLVLFGGTSEGRELARILTGKGWQVILCVATGYGSQVLGGLLDLPLLKVHVGPMGEQEMEELFRQESPRVVIDATHPYARVVSETVKQAAAQAGLVLFRCIRPSQSWEEGEDVAAAADLEEGVRFLAEAPAKRPGILVTTGSKELAAFQALPDYENRVYARVLPSHASLESCFQLGLKGRHVIAMQGPFSAATNAALLEEFDCGWLVTKDTGARGGFQEKLEGAFQAGAKVLVIGRPVQEEGLEMQQILEKLEQMEGRQNQ